MKRTLRNIALLASFTLCTALAEDAAKLSLHRTLDGVELTWPGVVNAADGQMVRPYFELQRSSDLHLWEPVDQRRHAIEPIELLSVTLGLDQPHSFYRLLSIQPPKVAKLSVDGAEVLGYGAAFTQELERIGQISPDQFAAMFPSTANYLAGISWDPTTAEFWKEFNANPDRVNAGKNPDQRGYRTFDARLDSVELGFFKKNGFVASERLGGGSFAEVFYNLWHNDLPVFISTDAILQAWHRTYDAMLEEVEETYLFNSVQTMLDAMAGQLTAASVQAGNGALRDSLLDADYFLAVARSLLAGTNNPPVPSLLGQDARVGETLADVQGEQLKEVPSFMGFCRMVDFSQFKVRGHYTHSERLGRYFQCVMWLGRIDVPVAGGPWERCPDDIRFTSPRETGFAIVLWSLLNQSGQFNTWADMERTIETFVGPTDSLTFGQLNGLLAGAGIRTLLDVPTLAVLEKLQNDIVSGQLGLQNIRSDWFEQPVGGAERYALPQTFTVFGQKFVPDSWAFSQNVFSSILWVENGQTNKVFRRVPGALDVAFSVLGNDQIVPELVAQMKGTFPNPDRPHAQMFRDGLPYEHNLAAVRAVMDAQDPSLWTANLYMGWLDCLRQLSQPTTDSQYPEAMRTRAWAMKTLNTQLASWTHLRHDTILYAKQSYTDTDQCIYPIGFVEPRIEFWNRLGQAAELAAERIARLAYPGSYEIVTNVPPRLDLATGVVIDEGGLRTNRIALAEIQNRQVNHLQNFAGVVGQLESLARKELIHACFTAEEDQFVDSLMEDRQGGNCGGGPIRYSGWFPNLFYRTIYWTDDRDFHANYGAGANDLLVADVHTDVPAQVPPDPGSVLHEAIGRVNLLMMAVDNGADRFICAGPVLSHYEFEVLGDPRRISDQEWGVGGIIDKIFPPDIPANGIEGLAPPVWTQGYLVPLRRQ